LVELLHLSCFLIEEHMKWLPARAMKEAAASDA
jgi:hypothetical protein